MNQPLDLGITLNLPPEDAPSEILASVALRCETLGLSHTGELLADPLTPQEREDLRWYLEEYPKWPYEGFLERGKQIELLLPIIGKRLYQAVFGAPEARQIVQTWQQRPAQERQISILSDVPNVLSLPWELLRDEDDFLVMHTPQPVSIVRRLPEVNANLHTIPFTPPLRILLVTARPKGTPFVDPRSIAHELVEALQGQIEAGRVILEFLRPPTFEGLRARLRDRKHPIQVLHFDGHGMFEQKPGAQGQLAFEKIIGQDGWLDSVEAERLASLLQESGVQLVVLTACQSAMGADDAVFSSVAAQLIHKGMDAVIAMSASVLVASATRYVEAFYRALAEGIPVPMAHERARQHLQRDPRRHLLHRHLEEEGQPVELHDWWLPHFYQQRVLTFQVPSSHETYQSQPASSNEALQRLNEGMPTAPRYGFTGRARELLEVERSLVQGKLMVLHGFGGSGKTALAREAADWLTRTGMYSRACFISFEHGGDASTLLSTLGHFLGIYDSHYSPQDHKAALAQLAPALKQRLTLVIADNLESLLPTGEAPLPLEERLALWETLLALAKQKAGVLLTSRDPQVGDGHLVQGKAVAHLPLGGMHPEDAYLFASRLLEKLKINRALAPYTSLGDLLKQLDYHPLAIQLVLPALRTHPLDIIRQQFAELLPHFTDDAATGRNRSLLASLQYSLSRLTDEQQALLPRLALFEGGASEDDLLAITEIPKAVWASLRVALEQAALLTAEKVADYTAPFLRFHPVLTPFLRSQSGTDGPALRERYAKRYCALANYLYHEDQRSPQPVRVLVRRELPNLRKALELLIEAGEGDLASQMAVGISWFQNIFGLGRERDELRRRMTEVVAARSTQVQGPLMVAEYFRETALSESEHDKGNSYAACARLIRLLERFEAQPEGMRLGRGSYEHSFTLFSLALYLKESGQYAAAEARYYEALTIINALIQQEPDNKTFISGRSMLLVDIGNVLRLQGRYQEARRMFKEALQATDQGNLGSQALILEKLGKLALDEQDYAEARLNHTAALALYHAAGELDGEASQWHHLSVLAYLQQDWGEAERCCREGLVIFEQLGETMEAAMACNLLSLISRATARLDEAEGWLRRALEWDEQDSLVRPERAIYFINLASLLLHKVQAGHAPKLGLTEARGYAERALAIQEPLDASSERWKTLGILADITELEGLAEAARAYRRRARETFAAFAGNRYHINLQFGQLIAAIAASAKGDAQARAAVEKILSQVESQRFATAIHRIWAGERDWHALAEDENWTTALLIKRVLETLEQLPAEDQQDDEDILHDFTSFIADVVRTARGHTQVQAKVEGILPQLEQNGWEVSAAIHRIWAGECELAPLVEGIDPNSALIIRQILERLAAPEEDEEDEEDEEEDDGIEALIEAVVMAAEGNQEARAAVEDFLLKGEEEGWQITEPIRRIWAGERGEAALVDGLNMQDTKLIQHILALLAMQSSTGEVHQQQANK